MSESDPRHCPRCDFEDPGPEECPRCGVVFRKLHAPPAPAPAPAPARPPSARPLVTASPAQRQSAVGWLLLLLVGVAGAAWYETRRDEPAPAAAVPVEAPSVAASPEPARGTVRPSATTPGGISEVEMIDRARHAVELAEAQAQAAPTPRPDTPFRFGYSWLTDRSGFDLGTRFARDENRVITLYVYTDWCPWCRRLDNEVFSDRGVQDCLAKSVRVKVNPEHGSAEEALARQFGVTGYPSLYRYDPVSGSVEELPTWWQVNGEWVRMEAPEFAAACQDWVR